MKLCNKCGARKSLDDFYKHPGSNDGRAGLCKECAKSRSRENRAKKAEYYKEYDAWRYKNDPKVEARHKRYQETDVGIAAMRRSQYKWINNNPEARAAHILVGNAIKGGRLVKPDHCAVCEEFTPSRKLHGHHDDYSKPLDVVWMCWQCHRGHHNS